MGLVLLFIGILKIPFTKELGDNTLEIDSNMES